MEINLVNNYKLLISFDYLAVINKFSQYLNLNKSMTLILIDEEEIKSLNNQYRNLNSSTDVLSFPADEDEYLGEVFICVDKVYEQAKEYKHSPLREFSFLLVHGYLHLQGYDHLTKESEEIMFELQNEILNDLGYRR